MKITRGRKARPRRVLLYGQHGIGKSTWGFGAPAPIFLQTEEGLDDVGADRCDLLTSIEDVTSALAWLYTEAHEYKTLVIDTIDWLEKIIWVAAALENKVSTLDDVGWGKGPPMALPYWSKFLAQCDAIRNQRGMNIVFLSHAKVTRFQDPKSDGYDRYEPDLHKSVCPMIQEWADEVLFAGLDVAVITKEDGFKKERSRAVDSNQRVVYTCEMPTHLAKRRIPMPDKIGLSWLEYQQHVDAFHSEIGNIEGIVKDGSSK